jgi:hypothetical protein
MKGMAVQLAVSVLLLGLGWAVGKAQTTQPQFELIVRAPAGETTIECTRGCELAWVERGLNPKAKPSSSFTFGVPFRVHRLSLSSIESFASL